MVFALYTARLTHLPRSHAVTRVYYTPPPLLALFGCLFKMKIVFYYVFPSCFIEVTRILVWLPCVGGKKLITPTIVTLKFSCIKYPKSKEYHCPYYCYNYNCCPNFFNSIHFHFPFKSQRWGVWMALSHGIHTETAWPCVSAPAGIINFTLSDAKNFCANAVLFFYLL